MRSPVELLELPYSFTQLRLLMPHQFISEAGQRGVYVSPDQLEALHRARLLVPLLRVRREGRMIASLARQAHVHARQVAHWQPTGRADLVDAANAGRPFDAAAEGFVSRDRRRRRIGEFTYLSSEYVYSPHQLIVLPAIKAGVPLLSANRTGVSNVMDPHWLRSARSQAARLRTVVVALSALEPVYHPRVVERLHIADYAAYDQWIRQLRPLALLRWLRVEPAWLKDEAARLLLRAAGIDPLGAWHELLREADPDQLRLLRGDARSAVDLRIAAEILLLYYECLVASRRASRLPDSGPRGRGPFHGRLKPQRGLDALLTRFGLSPHPSLVLVVEGDTELRLFPRLFEKFGIRTDPDYIAIENMVGATRDLSPLVGYLAPRGQVDERARYLTPTRPLTRVLVISDAEGQLRTTASRERSRMGWVDRIVSTLPREYRTDAARAALNELVFVETWTSADESFEFAHFTDRQLASALLTLQRGPTRPSLQELVSRVASVRRGQGNIASLMPGVSKVDLADALWPLLDAKIDRALARGTERRIPIVRMIDRAIELAQEVPRRGVVIPLRRAA